MTTAMEANTRVFFIIVRTVSRRKSESGGTEANSSLSSFCFHGVSHDRRSEVASAFELSFTNMTDSSCTDDGWTHSESQFFDLLAISLIFSSTHFIVQSQRRDGNVYISVSTKNLDLSPTAIHKRKVQQMTDLLPG